MTNLNIYGSLSMNIRPFTLGNSCLPENIASRALPGIEQRIYFSTLIPISPPISRSRISLLSDIEFYELIENLDYVVYY